jgi:hypothetical protein
MIKYPPNVGGTYGSATFKGSSMVKAQDDLKYAAKKRNVAAAKTAKMFEK